MQQSTRDMQAQGQTGASLNGIVASADQIALSEMQNGHSSQAPFDHGGSVGHDDFLDQMLSGLRSPWAELGTPKAPWDAPDSEVVPAAAQRIFGVGKEAEEGLQYASFDESTLLANRLRQYQISGRSSPVGKAMVLPLSHHGQQQMLATSGDSGFLPLPLTLGSCGSSDSPNPTVGDGLYNGFSGALQHTESANQHTFPHPQSAPVLGQNFGAAPLAPGLTQAPAAAASASAGGGTGAPRQKVRARRGQATDPHSIAERLRRERIAERMKALQELVPNANKTDKASMLDEIIDYVKFLQLQVKSVAGRAVCAAGGSSDSLTVTEHQVAKLMEEDMGSAMQYLQGKGLCLMPISLASAISSATSSFHRPLSSSSATHGHLHPLPNASSCDAPSSPAASALSAHSAMANAAADAAKDTVVVSKA